MKSNWEKDMHDRLGNFEQDAPDGLWSDISGKMTEQKDGYMRTSRYSTSYKLRRAASVAAAACVVLIVGYTFHATRIKKEGANTLHSDSVLAKDESGYSRQIPQDDKTVTLDKPCPTSGKMQRDIESIGESAVAFTGTTAVVDTILDDIKEMDAKVKETENKERENTGKKGIDDPYKREGESLIAYNHRPKSNNAPSRWTLSASTTGAVGWEKSTTNKGEPIVSAGPEDSDWQDNPMLGINLFNQGKEVKTEYKHHLPILVAVKVAYALNRRVSMESGLAYTRLSSDIKNGSDNTYFAGTQSLNYVGIPIGVRCNALAFKRFSLYGNANVLLEKCVSGTITNNYVINGSSNKTENHTICSKPLQLSVGAGVGVQIDVFDNMGIYAEPGLSYHFDDQSSLQTIYKEKPLNFNLSIGIRYTIDE